MFLGHFAVALAAKRAAPRTSLGTLFMASQWIDLLWPLFLLAGIEHVRVDPGNTAFTPLDFYDYPYTHSLRAVIVWAAVVCAIYYGLKRYRAGTIVVALTLFSHWILDVVTHRPDLPLGPNTDVYFGLGLWNSVVGTVVSESILFGGGILLYLRSTRPKGNVGVWGFWGLIVFLVAIYITNVLGPPPPDESMIAIAGNAMWLIVLWGYWIDRHRASTIELQNNSS
jgi:membrane-bound metal-dependent hydrolase YbcI (DUF457 family)